MHQVLDETFYKIYSFDVLCSSEYIFSIFFFTRHKDKFKPRNLCFEDTLQDAVQLSASVDRANAGGPILTSVNTQ